MNKMILASAPNGAYKQKADHPDLPLSDAEIISLVQEIDQEGIPMVHLHIRDENNQHSIDPAHYQRLLAILEASTSLLIQVTSEAAGIFSAEAQIQMIRTLKPKFVSIALREITRASTDEVQQLFGFMRTNNISPQIILYNLQDVQLYLALLANKTLVGRKFPVLYVAGRDQTEGTPSIEQLKEMVKTSKNFTHSWMLCGFDVLESLALDFALKENGHIRIGFENNLKLDSGIVAKNNSERLNEVVQKTQLTRQLTSVQDTQTLMTPLW